MHVPTVRPARRSAPFALALAVFLAAPSAALAQDDRAELLSDPTPPAPTPSPVRLELLAGATVPLDVGARARLVLWDRVLFGLSLGVGAYGEVARAITDIAGAEPAGAQIAADLANGLFSGELSVGVRPFDGAGFELAVGYALLHRRLALDGSALASALGAQAALPDVTTSLTLHAIHGEIGWTIAILDHLVLRPAIGWLQVLGADVSLTADGASARERQVLDAAALAMEGALTRWGMTPTLSLALGYRF